MAKEQLMKMKWAADRDKVRFFYRRLNNIVEDMKEMSYFFEQLEDIREVDGDNLMCLWEDCPIDCDFNEFILRMMDWRDSLSWIKDMK